MKTVSVNLYTFDELGEDAQQKAIEDNREINVDYHGWWDFVYWPWEDKLEEMGFCEPEIRFSGFGSQGDGASFTAGVDIAKFARYHNYNRFRSLVMVQRNGWDVDARIVRVGHYYVHHNTIKGVVEGHGMYYSDDEERTARVYSQGEELEGYITEVVRQKSKLIYNDLREAYFALTSDEAVADTLRANDYEFLEDGSRPRI
jgi:hypothetical protein